MRALIAGGVLLLLQQGAFAQNPFVSKPIDTDKLIVKPADAATTVTANASSGVFRGMARSVANVIEDNGFVRTINNLLGRRAKDPVPQAGFSPLPQVSTFRSTGYANSFRPVAVPIAQPYGQTPTNLTLPTPPSAQR